MKNCIQKLYDFAQNILFLMYNAIYLRYKNKLRSFKIRSIYFFTVLLNLIFVFHFFNNDI